MGPPGASLGSGRSCTNRSATQGGGLRWLEERAVACSQDDEVLTTTRSSCGPRPCTSMSTPTGWPASRVARVAPRRPDTRPPSLRACGPRWQTDPLRPASQESWFSARPRLPPAQVCLDLLGSAWDPKLDVLGVSACGTCRLPSSTAAPTAVVVPRAQPTSTGPAPEQRGSLPWPQELCSGRPKDHDFPLFNRQASASRSSRCCRPPRRRGGRPTTRSRR